MEFCDTLYLAEERVLVPSRVGLDLIVEDGGRISFAPKIDGVESDAMRHRAKKSLASLAG
jgi:hypothetical protein